MLPVRMIKMQWMGGGVGSVAHPARSEQDISANIF
jgi:hypothetical protein